MASVKATVGTRVFDLDMFRDTLNWCGDFVTGVDLQNAAKNCQELRSSPLSDQIEEAIAFLDEMEAHQTHVADQAHGIHGVFQG